MTANRGDSLQIDPELFADFLSESLETLDGLDSLFVALESRPDDTSIVDRIFRPVHSIKGNSSFFGLVNLKNFSHDMESVLQDVRSRKRTATPELISALLRGVDLLRNMLERYRAGEMEASLLPEEESFLSELSSISEQGQDQIAVLASQIREHLSKVQAGDLTDPVRNDINAMAECVDRMLKTVCPPAISAGVADDGSAVFRIGGADVSKEIRSARQFIHDISKASNSESDCDQFLSALDVLDKTAREAGDKALVDNIGAVRTDFVAIHDSGIGFDDLLADLLHEKFDAVINGVEVCDSRTRKCMVNGQPSGEIALDKTSAPPTVPDKATTQSEPQSGKTLRVAEEKVDSFMSYVGELIISSEVFAYIQKKLETYPEVREITQEFKNANLAFNDLSTQLQKSLMAVRRIPVRTMTQKLPRIVRDTSSQVGKEIELFLEGGDLQVDKSILEGLESPIVHMVRNSVDHGIELPDERIAAGKPRGGTVRVRADADEETFSLTIEDDGRGLDVAAIKEKALEKGTITAEQASTMSDQDAFGLIFGAGVSTAKEVTDISGRGVGMDVVMNSIRRLNGQIEVDSELGKGTVIRITMPMTVTLLVIDGLVARIANHEYIIPLSDVQESVRPSPGQVQTVSGRGEMMDVRGELYPLLRLHEILGAQECRPKPEDGTVVLVQCDGRSCGLLVDELLGQQSVVLKDLGEQFKALHILKGAAILGDGRVGLVFDTEGLLLEAER